MGYHRVVKRRIVGDAAVIAVYAALFVISLSGLSPGRDILTVETDNGTYAYSLKENGIHSFEGPLGITEIEIKDGRARVISSPCRNGICMEAGWSDTLCCLPNRIVAVSSSEEGGPDALSG